MLSEDVASNPLAVTMRNTLEQFVQRMQGLSASGQSIAVDPVVLSLYQSLTALQPQLLKQVDELQQKKGSCVGCLFSASSLLRSHSSQGTAAA